jgi:hypothetical protein
MSALRVGIMLPSRETAMTGRHDARGLVEFAKSAEEAESDAVGIPFAGRGARLDETVTLWRQTWDGQGEFADALPAARSGGPPVWLAGGDTTKVMTNPPKTGPTAVRTSGHRTAFRTHRCARAPNMTALAQA